jgi:hypothetical protein
MKNKTIISILSVFMLLGLSVQPFILVGEMTGVSTPRSSVSGAPTDFYFYYAVMTHEKGSSLVQYDISGYPQLGSDYVNGLTTMNLVDWFDILAININTGTISAAAHLDVRNSEPCSFPAYYSGGASHGNFNFKFKSPFVILNSSTAPFVHAGAALATSTVYVQYCVSTYTGLFADTLYASVGGMQLTYDLHPTISLNSSYYNLDNVKIQIETYRPTNVDPYPYSLVVEQQDPYNIVLTHPYYRLFVYDKETNATIYSDPTQVVFSAYRTINISSLKVQNNAAEPINCSLVENTGHYQGQYSFDNDIVNTLPVGFTKVSPFYDEDWFVITEFSGHSKVLKCLDTRKTSSSYSSMRINFNSVSALTMEYWMYTNSTGGSGAIQFGSVAGMLYLGWKNSQYFTHMPGGYSTYYLGILQSNSWNHIKISMNAATQKAILTVNGTVINNSIDFRIAGTEFTYAQLYAGSTSLFDNEYYFDAIDFSFSTGYIDSRNKLLNNSGDLLNWNAFPEWETGYYQGDYLLNQGVWTHDDGWTNGTYIDSLGRKNILQIGNTSSWMHKSLTVNIPTNFNLEFWFYETGDDTGGHHFNLASSTWGYNLGFVSYNGGIGGFDSTGWLPYIWTSYQYNIWNHVMISINSSNGYMIYLNSQLLRYGTIVVGNNIQYLQFANDGDNNYYYSGIDVSTSSGYFLNRNMLENTTTSKLNMQTNLSLQINPYSSSISNFTQANYIYRIADLYNNTLQTANTTNNIITYTPANTRQCFISVHDQQNNYVDWNSLKIRVNQTLIYSNSFYREIGTIWNISIYNQHDHYLNSLIYTVARDENYLPIQITLHSLKIYNQQEIFIHSNVTLDPNYYPTSTLYWSEWLAPGEIAEYKLWSDFYRVAINNTGSVTYYSYTLNGDDVLLVQSINTIANVLQNIQNINSSIGNQITNVQINLTNQNSAINNSVINLDINISNMNSTLGEMLLNTNTTLNVLSSNLTTLYVYQQNQFSLITNQISNSFISLNDSVFLINNSIYTAINSLESNLNIINNTIAGNLSLLIAKNDYLTQIYQYTMFSDFLDWSNVTHNQTYLTNQIETVKFMNKFYNQSAEIYLRYANQTESLLSFAQDKTTQMLPTGTEYRIKSLGSGKYLDTWKPINKTISFGYDDREYASTEINLSGYSIVDVLVVLAIIAISTALFVYTLRKLKSQNIVKTTRRETESSRSRSVQPYNPIDSIRGR